MNPSHSRRNYAPDKIKRFSNESTEAIPLMELLTARLTDATRTTIKSLLRHGQVKLDGRVTSQFDAPAKPGSIVEINFSKAWPVFSNPRLQIVYEDDDIIVINKGYGLLSVGTGNNKNETTAYNILKDYVKSIDPINKIFVVHRLDRGTSGLMMFARNPQSQEAMQHNWKNMVLDRRYVAVLEGLLENDEGVVRSNLGETSQYEVYSTDDISAGKPAATHYRVLRRGRGFTLTEFRLETGRKNQIRVHARDLGHPITGDRKYGAQKSPIKRIALHAMTLRFAHPITRKLMTFELPVPQKFISLVR